MKKVVLFASIPLLLFSCSDIGLGDTIGNEDSIYIDSSLEVANDTRSATQTVVDTYASIFETVGELVQELTDAASFTDEEYEAKLKELESAIETITQLETQLDDIENTDGQKLTDLLAFKNAAEKIEQIKEALKEGTDTSAAKEEIAALLKELSGACEEDTPTTIAEAVSKIKEQIAETRTELEALLTAEEKEALGDEATVEEIIQKIEEKLSAQETELEDAKETLCELLTDEQKAALTGSETLEDIIEQIQDEIEEKTIALEDAKTALTELLSEEQKSALTGDETVSDIIEKVEAQISAKDSAIAAKQAEIEEKQATIDGLTAQIQAANLSDDEKAQQIGALSAEISALNGEITALESEVSTLESDNATAKATLTALLDDPSSVSETATASEVAALVKAKLEETQEELDKKTEALEEATDSIAATKNSIAAILTNLDENADTQKSTEELLNDISTKITALENEKTTFETQYSELENENTNLNAQVSELTNEKSTLQESIDSLTARVAELENEIASGQLAYSELQKQMTIKKGDDTSTLYKDTCLEGVDLTYFGQSAIVVDASSSGFFICISETEGSTLFAVFDTSDWGENKSFTIYEGTTKSEGVTVDKSQGYREMHNLQRGQTYQIETSDGSAIKIKALVDGYENISKLN